MTPFRFFGLLALVFVTGSLFGRVVTLSFLPESIPVVLEHVNIDHAVPVIDLVDVQDHHITGMLTGDVRLFANGEQIVPAQSGAVRIPIEPFLTQYVDVLVPDDARFVASKRGSRYYPVGSAAGDALSPQNRVYFSTQEEAKAAGYR